MESFFAIAMLRYRHEPERLLDRFFGDCRARRSSETLHAMFLPGNFYILPGRLRLVRRFRGAHIRVRVCFV